MRRAVRSHFWALLLIAVFVHFYRYGQMTLSFTGSFTLDLIELEDRARHEPWDKVIASQNDDFVTRNYADRNKIIVGWGTYNYCDLPVHFFYKVLGLRGETLWLASKFLTALLGVVFIMTVYALARLLFNIRIAFLAGLIMAFSPHLWAPFHTCGNLDRTYNLIMSTLGVYGFARALKEGRRRWLWISGASLGLNILFFNIGSPMMPLILVVYSIVLSVRSKTLRPLKSMGFVLLVMVLTALWGNMAHTIYSGGHFNPLLEWVRSYMAWGSSASHSKEGMSFLNPYKFFINTMNHIKGVFINGRTDDWHTNVSLPNVPMVYSYFVTGLFFAGFSLARRRRRAKDLLLLTWFSVFFVVYCMIFVRQKNIVWELIPIFILAARSVPWFALCLHNLWPRIRRRLWQTAITWILVLSTALTGFVWIFAYLPARNYYDGVTMMGTHQLYRVLKARGMDDRTLTVFTYPGAVYAVMMTRLFAQHTSRVAVLEYEGVPAPADAAVWKRWELGRLKEYDRIHFCFWSFDNTLGNSYSDDQNFRKVFERLHPKAAVRSVRGMNKSVIWRVYTVTKDDASALEAISTEPAPAAVVAPPPPPPPPLVFTDRMAARTFKVLGRSFLSMADFDRLKSQGIKQIRKMSEEKWKKRFAAVYDILKDLPDDLKEEYAVNDKMTREDVLANIREFDKERALELIDVIPDELIASKFREYLEIKKRSSEDGNVVTLIKNMWQKALMKLENPGKKAGGKA